jgi:hypothetical protein
MDMFSNKSKEKTTKSKGPEAADGNWVCESCSNVNWSWRTECKRCHASAPEEVVFITLLCNI